MTKSSPKARRRWPAISAGFVLALGLAVWLALPPVAAFLMERALQRAGFPDAAVASGAVDFGLNRVSIDHIVLGTDLNLEGIQAEVPVSRLIRGEAAALRLRRATVRVQWTPESGISIPGHRPSAGPPLAAVPVDRIRVDRLELMLESPYGSADVVAVDFDMRAAGPQLMFDGGLRMNGRHGALQGKAAGRIDLRGPALQTRLKITGGDLSQPDWHTRGLEGTLAVNIGADRPLQAEIDMRAGETRVSGFTPGALALTGSWRDTRFEGRLYSPEAGPVRIEADLEADFSRGNPRFSSSGTLNASHADGPAANMTYDALLIVDPGDDPVRLSGNMALIADNIRVPGSTTDGEFRLHAGLAGPMDALMLTARAPVSGHITPATAVLPAALAPYGGRPIGFRLTGPAADAPLSLRIDATAPSVSGRVALALDADGAGARIAGEFNLRRADRGFMAAAEGLDLTARELPWRDGTINILEFHGEWRGVALDDWSLAGKGRVAASGELGTAAYDNFALAWSGTVSASGGVISANPDSPLTASLDTVTSPGMELRGLAIPPIDTAQDNALLSYRIGPGEIHFNLETSEHPLAVTLVTGRERHLSGRWPSLSLSGHLTPEGIRELSGEMAGGTVQEEDMAVSLRDLTGKLSKGPGSGFDAEFRAGTLESLSAPPLWSPVSLEITTTEKDGKTTFEAFLSDTLGLFVFEAAGGGSFESGAADLTLYPINFLSGATETGDLSPRLAETVSEVSGSVAFNGHVAWGAGIESRGTLSIEDLAGRVSALHIAGLNGAIEMTSLLPPATNGTQTLLIERVNAGVLLTEGRIVFDKAKDKPPEIGPFRFTMGGGSVSAAPFTLDLSETGETRFILTVQDVDLARMVTELGIEGLKGTGTLAGRVPVVIGRDGVRIESGGFQAVSDGQLHYNPDELPRFLQGEDQRSRMLRQVLRNFHYNDLSVSLSGGIGDDTGQKMTLAVKGRNPDFQDGHPVELNINFEGSLLSALERAVSISGGNRLQRIFEKRERQEVE